MYTCVWLWLIVHTLACNVSSGLSNPHGLLHNSVLHQAALGIENSLEDFTWPKMVKGIVRSSKPLSVHFADGVYKRTGEVARLLRYIAKERGPQAPERCELKSAQGLNSEIDPMPGLTQ